MLSRALENGKRDVFVRNAYNKKQNYTNWVSFAEPVLRNCSTLAFLRSNHGCCHTVSSTRETSGDISMLMNRIHNASASSGARLSADTSMYCPESADGEAALGGKFVPSAWSRRIKFYLPSFSPSTANGAGEAAYISHAAATFGLCVSIR